MTQKPEKNDELPHITLSTKDEVKKRKTGSYFGSKNSKHVSQDEFRNMLGKAVSVGSVISGELRNSYFLIDLNTEYYTADVSNMLNGLGLEIKTVMSENQIIVKGRKDNLEQVIGREKIPKKFTKTIKRILSLSGEKKLGEHLLRIMKQDVDSTKVIPVCIKFIDNLEEAEEREFKSIIDQRLNKDVNPQYLRRSKQFICGSSSKRIKNLAELPFIKSINKIPKIQAQQDDSEEVYLKKGEYEIIPKKVRPLICTIDSGVSGSLSQFCEGQDKFIFPDAEDTIGHGTGVASVAIFGEDAIRKSKRLVQKAKIISFKVDDLEKRDVLLEEAIMKAIEKYRHKTRVFSISYNYVEVDPEFRLDVVKKLDPFLQEQNVILVISGGNIEQLDALAHKTEYPGYLSKFPVLSPAEAKNAVSAGAICNKSTASNPILSVITRMGLHPVFLQDDLDKYRFFKPDVYTFGGNSELKREGTGIQMSKDLHIAALSLNGNLVYKMGTSYAAPLIALCYARLIDKYDYKNSETYRAMMLSQTSYHNVNDLPVHHVYDTSNVGQCNDGVYLNFEGEVTPKIKVEDVKKTNALECKTVEFYMPDEADSVDIFTVHSNNYQFQDLRKHNTRLVAEIIKSNGVTIKKKYGTAGRYCTNTYTRYNFKRDYEGTWKIKVHIEPRGIPANMLKGLRVRFGVSFRINLKKSEIGNLKEVYEKVLTKSGTKQAEEPYKTAEYVKETGESFGEQAETDRETAIATVH